VVIVSSQEQYTELINVLEHQDATTTLEERKNFASKAFGISSHYDTTIFNYFNEDTDIQEFRQSFRNGKVLRYGENPHQKGSFYGDFNAVFDKLHGKEISYNNLLDIEAGVNLISEFTDTTFAILKHNNACGLASRDSLLQSYKDALSGDPVSAFGGILATNRTLNAETAEDIHNLFFEVIIAPAYDDDALEILKQKKNRIILVLKNNNFPTHQFRSLLNGVIYQDRDLSVENQENMKVVTDKSPTEKELSDLAFANIIVKHTKSNAIVLVKNKQLVASGVGQTSRVDALRQAIQKAQSFGFSLNGAVMASDAFFPFPDSVEIADGSGIKSVVQPGGSVRDQDSIDYCNKHGLSMVFTGVRHFKH
jgi:phosphoribosylaminoimidazolecarboxamide formyltransferase/IMP cyclohydrolase